MSDFLKRIEGLSPKRLALLALELQSTVERLERDRAEPIAVVGIGCRMPGDVDGPDSFWALLAEGRDAVSEVPSDRWPIDELFDADPDAPGKMSSKWGGFLSQVDRFDAPFFGISRREAVSMDPQQRMLLEVAWEALEHAGMNPHALGGSATGVFLGLCTSDYHSMLLDRGRETIDAYVATGTAHSVAAGRIAYVLGLQGPNIAIDTACSSSLVAVHLACQSLLSGDCRVALAGGANALLAPDVTIALSKSHMMAPDGRCKAFDERADGFVRGEGCGIIILKRLSHAQADGDRVLALIRASAVNQDGRSSGITAPNGASQEAVMRAALARAGVTPAAIQYVEAHGTGTELGDPIEAHALRAVMEEGRSVDSPLVVGSVKTNLGHLESAAGISGLIKVVLSLQHEWIPKHLHFTRLNPHIDWAGFPVEIPVSGRSWRRDTQPRLAGVSSFGFGGTNAHVILEEAPVDDGGRRDPEPPVSVLTLSARTPTALQTLTARYASWLRDHPECSLAEMCDTANTGRAPLAERAAYVAASRPAMAAALLEQRATSRSRVTSTPGVAFLFTGQGAQYAGMGRQLYETEPVFRAAIDECGNLLAAQVDTPLQSLLWGDETAKLETDTTYTQPAVFALQWALAQLWRSWGVQPAVVLGHSVGEYAAACVAGVFTLADALRLIAIRGRLTGQLPRGRGAMAAILAPRAFVDEAVARAGANVGIAAVNGPEHVVVSGDVDRVAAVEAHAAAAGYRVERLRVSHAFHSALMAPIEAAFEAEAARLTISAPTATFISSVSGRVATAADLRQPSYWRRQIREAVLFDSAVSALADQSCSAFLEIGPGSTLLGLGSALVGRDSQAWVPSIRRSRPDVEQMAESAAMLWSQGVDVNWAAREPQRRTRVPLPTYPFERERYWLDTAPAQSRGWTHKSGGAVARRDAAVPIYDRSIDPGRTPWIADHRVGGTPLMPAAGFVDAMLEAASDALGLSNPALTDFAVTTPLRAVNLEDNLHLQAVVTPGGAGPASVQVFSRPTGMSARAEWTLHATAAVARDRHPDGGEALPALRSRIHVPGDPEAFYAAAAASGIELGPGCRGIRKVWVDGHEVLAEVALPGQPSHGASPALLDSCLQVLGVAVTQAAAAASQPYVLSRIGRLDLFDSLSGTLSVHAKLARSSGRDGFLGELRVFDRQGTLVARATDVLLGPVAGVSHGPAHDWFYSVEWRRMPLDAVTALNAGDVMDDTALVERVRQETTGRALEHGLDRYLSLRPRLDAIVSAFVGRALEQLGARLQPGMTFEATRLRSELGVAERHVRLFGHFLTLLREDGLLSSADGTWRVERALGGIDPVASCDEVASLFPEFSAEIALTRGCGVRLADVLRGQVDATDVLAPGGDFDMLERLYVHSPAARVFNPAVRSVLSGVLARATGDRPVRVLEIGAGTGGTTTYLETLLTGDQPVDYLFTDITPAFTRRARQRFAAVPAMRFGVFDVERSPAEQDVPVGGCDVVIAANVLHATADLRRTVSHARAMLRPGGLLIALEGTRPERWIDMTFGLTEGWWKFSDELRPEYPLMDAEGWTGLLSTERFDRPLYLGPAIEAQQTIILARADAGSGEPARARCLVVGDGPGAVPAVCARLAALGADATLVADAAAAARAIGEQEFHHVVLFVGSGGSVSDPAALCSPVLDVLRAVVAAPAAMRFWIVTGNAQAVVPDDAANPGHAAVWGIGRTAALEHPDRWGGLIDCGAGESASAVADVVAREILAGSDEDQVAYRAGDRFVARLARASAPDHVPAIDPDGAYIVTGGLGRLGLHVAEWLVQQGARHLILAGRRGLPDRAEWAGLAKDSREGRAAAGVGRIEAAGAVVTVVVSDMAVDGWSRELHAALAGRPLKGVVHAAALFDPSPLVDLTPAGLRSVLAPKTGLAGGLADLAGPDDLDFVVLFSSTTALLGVKDLGGYAAANAYLDSLAVTLAAEGYPAVSVNWGTWDELDDLSDDVRHSYVRAGLHPMPMASALEALGTVLAARSPQIVIADVDWSVLRPLYEARRRKPMLEELTGSRRIVPGPAAPAPAEDLTARLLRAREGERLDIVLAAVRAEAAAVLGVQADEVDPVLGLFEMGMDSLMSVELRRRLQTLAGIPLPSTLTFNYPTVHALAGYLFAELMPAVSGTVADAPEPIERDANGPEPADGDDSNLDDLSEDSLAALLTARLSNLER